MPKNKSQKTDRDYNSLGSEIFSLMLGSWNALNIAMNVEDFEKWLWSNYKMILPEVFEGFKILLGSSLNTFIYLLAIEQDLGLKEDFVFYRARFNGTPMNKFPSTCEKSHLIKNLDKFRRKVINSKTPEELKKSVKLFRDNVLEIFRNIYEEYAEPNRNISVSKSELLNYATIDCVFTFLDDLRQGYPQGIILNPFDGKPSWWYMELEFTDKWRKGLRGYAYTLQYIWHMLLGDKIKNTSLINMHNVNSTVKLDEYFEIIEKEIINPIESKIGGLLGAVPLFFISSTVPKSLFGKLLEKPSTLKLGTSEYLDYLLLWYSVEVIDSSNGLIFNSTPTILSLFVGNIHIRREYEIEDKLLVIKFIHPNNMGHDYSYGILIESRGSIADYSGWIIFLDCCGDYSGFNFSLYNLIEQHLDKYWDEIEITEYEISKEEFRKYLMSKSPLKSKLELWRALTMHPSFERLLLEDIKGAFLEMLVYYMESFDNDKRVVWRQKINGLEHDILIEDEKQIKIIECKTELSNYDLGTEIEKLKNKIKKYPSEKRKIGFFYTWHPIRPEQINILKKENIGYKVMSDEVKVNRAFRNVKLKDIIRLFEYEKLDKKMIKELKKYIDGMSLKIDEDFKESKERGS